MKTALVVIALTIASSAWAYDPVEGFQRGMDRIDAERRHDESMKVQQEMLESQQRQEFRDQENEQHRRMEAFNEQQQRYNDNAMEIINGRRNRD